MQGQHAGKSRQHRAKSREPLGPLPVDDVGPDFAELAPDGASAALVAGAEPADARDMQTVEKNIVGQLLRRLHRIMGAGDDVNFHFPRQFLEALQERLGRRTEPRHGILVIPELVTIVADQESGFDKMGKEKSGGGRSL